MKFEDPIQKHFNKLVEENHEQQGISAEDLPANRLLTPKEYFETRYQGEPDSELPKAIFGDLEPEEIEILKAEYAKNNPSAKKNDEVKQLDLFKD